MNRFTRKIKNKTRDPIQIIILAAGASARTRSYEPRCLLKYEGKTIIDHQLLAIERNINKYEVAVVSGVEQSRLLKKLDRKIKVLENSLHEQTNSGESMRIGFNYSAGRQILFIHGDVILDQDIFKKVNFDESFILVDSTGKIGAKEVGASMQDGKLLTCCYNMPVKWAQVVFFAEYETKILEKMLWKEEVDTKHLLSYEIINLVVENGGSFSCIDIKNKFIKEVDSLKDLQ